MGAGQSVPADAAPTVVKIERTEIPDAYKSVGVSDEVVRRVNQNISVSALGTVDTPKSKSLEGELAHQLEENAKLRQQMQQLTALQGRHVSGQTAPSAAFETPEDIEEKKRVFDQTVERVEKQFFNYRRENACADNEKEILACLNKNKGKELNCKVLKAPYDQCIGDFRNQVLGEAH